MWKGAKSDLSYLEKDILNDSSKSVFWQFIITLPGKFYAKIETKYLTVFEQLASKYKKGQIWHVRPWKTTFRAILPKVQIYLSICDVCHPKEAPCQKIRKFTEARVSQIYPPPPPSILTDGQTDNSALEKIRCLLVGGAKKLIWNQKIGVKRSHHMPWHGCDRGPRWRYLWETPNDLGQSTTLDPPLP